jgi:ABC-type sugar transport system permease subunit
VLWILMLPAVICESLVYVLPIAGGIFTSFTQVDQFTIRRWFSAPFRGLRQFPAHPRLGRGRRTHPALPHHQGL